MKFAVVKTGGKQYVVKENDEIVVDFLHGEPDDNIELEKLAEGDLEKGEITLGTPVLKNSTKAKVLMNIKGDKLRVARFRSKTRTRKVTGFRAMLTRLKIVSI